MAKKSFVQLQVRVDEPNLVSLGYEITDAQARLVYEYDDWDKKYEYQIHWAIRGRFRPEHWRDRFTEDWAPPLVPVVRIPALGPIEMVYRLDELDDSQTTVRIADRHDLCRTKKTLDLADAWVALTAFDSASTDYYVVPVQKRAREIPVEIEGEPAPCGCAVRVLQSLASIAKDSPDDDPFLQVLFLGYVEICEMKQEHPLPRIGFEVVDDTGFPLDDESVAHLDAQSGSSGALPTRPPRWLFAERYDLDRYSAEPARVVVRVQHESY